MKFYCSVRYDSAGNRSHYSSISAKQNYCYDGEGRISGIDFSHATTADYSYDEQGHLAEERYTIPDGEVPLLYRYDPNGNIIEERRWDLETGNIKVTTRSYDSSGRLKIKRNSTERPTHYRLQGEPADTTMLYGYSATEDCIETPLGSDCSCATLATVTAVSEGEESVIGRSCFTSDGKLRWQQNFRKFNRHCHPLVHSFSLFDAKGRDSITVTKGVSFYGKDLNYPPGCGCIPPDNHTTDTTRWLAVFSTYDRYGNFLREMIYIYDDLAALRNGNGNIAREISIDITVDDYGNWTRWIQHIDGRASEERIRLITYGHDTRMPDGNHQPQELR